MESVHLEKRFHLRPETVYAAGKAQEEEEEPESISAGHRLRFVHGKHGHT